MKYKIQDQPVYRSSIEDLHKLECELLTCYNNLTESQSQLDTVVSVMDNVHISIQILKEFGDRSVSILNSDHGLESLLHLPEPLIDAKMAIEKLESSNEGLISNFVNVVKSIIKYIIDTLIKFGQWLKEILHLHRDLAAELNDAVKDMSDKEYREKSANLVADKIYRHSHFAPILQETYNIGESILHLGSITVKQMEESNAENSHKLALLIEKAKLNAQPSLIQAGYVSTHSIAELAGMGSVMAEHTEKVSREIKLYITMLEEAQYHILSHDSTSTFQLKLAPTINLTVTPENRQVVTNTVRTMWRWIRRQEVAFETGVSIVTRQMKVALKGIKSK